jgi:uncharacterized protein YndB with AHSA1/START domain
VIEVKEKGGERLVIEAALLGMRPEELYRYWTEPELITDWFPPQAEMDVREGGEYHLWWPTEGWHVRGRYKDMVPGEKLIFTWKWDHEPHIPERAVTVLFEDAGEGAKLTLVHTGGSESEHEEHVQGWLHFLPRLEAKVRGDAGITE